MLAKLLIRYDDAIGCYFDDGTVQVRHKLDDVASSDHPTRHLVRETR